MFKSLVKLAAITFMSITSLSFGSCGGSCVQSFEIGVGWRKDNLKWNVDDVSNSCSNSSFSSASSACYKAEVYSDLHFKDIEMYTVNAKAHWAGSEYYIRLAGDYGSSFKGQGWQRFGISASVLSGSLSTSVSNPTKRRSEFYDFTGAVGYPFMTCNNSLLIVPVVGYSFHRQRIKVKEGHHDSFSSDFSLSSSNPFFSSSSIPSSYSYSASSSDSSFSSSSESSSSDDFDPFQSSSSSSIAGLVGFSPEKLISSYRFSWYGPLVGLDIAYGLDNRWTVFGEFEYHFYDRCNRKRNSVTAVNFIDHYHSKKSASGFNGTVGTTWDMGCSWYTTVAVDFKYWKSDGHDDKVEWSSVGANIALGCMF